MTRYGREVSFVDIKLGEFGYEEQTFPKPRKADVIKEHEEKSKGLNLMDSGTASTTKKIMNTSLSSMKRLADYDKT